MDLNYILIWMVGAGLVTLFLRSLQHPFLAGRAWRLICPAIGLVMYFTWKTAPQLTGAVGVSLYLSLAFVPTILTQWVDRLATTGKFDRAKTLANIARVLHPTEGLWDVPHLVSVLQHWSRGEENAALKLWKTLSPEQLVLQPFSRSLTLQALLANAEWERAAALTAPTKSSDWWIDAYLPLFRMRALGELGQLEEQLKFYEAYLLNHRPYLSTIPTAALFLYSFHGRTDLVESLLSSTLVHLPADNQKFWRATALWFQGQSEAAELQLQELIRTADARTKRGAERRLKSSREPLPLDPTRHQRLDELHTALVSHLKQATRPARRKGTGFIMAVLVAVYFVAEWMGGSTNLDVLATLGAAHPVILQISGQWWRLFTAGLLHYGFVHLAMNLVGLLFLGPVVESLLGTWKYVALFFICMVFSVVGVMGMSYLELMPAQWMIGASGGVMGLVGWLAAYFLREWIRFRTPVNRHRMQALGMALVIQVAFDLSTENVSFAGHLGGLLAGFTLGMIHRPRKEN